MLINLTAAEKLKVATRMTYYPYTTHYQRNEAARIFLQEAGRLLDQKAESTVKHAVEIYCAGEIPYERYLEMVEHVSNEEAVRGAAYGGEYARNRVFDFAQRMLDQTKGQAHEIELAEVKKQYELEKQKTEQSINAMMQQYTATLETMAQQHEDELKALIQKVQEEFAHHQETMVGQTKTEFEQVILKSLQDERERQEREIREQERLQPAREAARAAIERVALLESKVQSHKEQKDGLMGLGIIGFLSLVIILLFFSFPQWIIAILLVIVASMFVALAVWKSPVSEEKIAEDKRQIALYQTKSDQYAALSEEERCALLVQRIA